MSTPFYTPMLTSAWRTAIRERRLWVVAIFAGLVLGSGFGSAIIRLLAGDPTQQITLLIPFTPDGATLSALWHQARTTGPLATAGLLGLGAVVLAIGTFLVYMVTMSTNAVLLGNRERIAGHSVPRTLFRAGRERFWPSFATIAVMRVIGAIIILCWMGLFARTLAMPETTGVALAAAGFVIATLLLAVLHIVTPLALIGVVLDRQRVRVALAEAFALLRTYRLVLTEFSLLLTAAHIVFYLALIIGGALIAIPYSIVNSIAVATGSLTLFRIALIGTISTFLVFAIACSALFASFIASMWTQLAVRLTTTGEAPEAWITRRFR
ncbi:MAG: hypothetical protein Q7T01_01885 [bacterium]|nr:hypothetical protein [bacterium]